MNIFITGGAGYVGKLLVPQLLKEHNVTIYDLYIYGKLLDEHPNLTQIVGDIRDRKKLIDSSKDFDIFIHLASTGAPDQLPAQITESIGFLATYNVVDACKINKVRRLIVASSTSTYGIKPLDISVTEDATPEPVDDYGIAKMKSDALILNAGLDSEIVIVRPSTLCGYSPRMRLDLAVNALSISALVNKKITVFGGQQMRPTLNVLDMVRFYETVINAPKDKVDRQAFNVTFGNKTIIELAYMVQEVMGNVDIEFQASDDDKRSYHVNADKMKKVLDFECKYTLKDGVRSIIEAYDSGLIPNAMKDNTYYNARRILEISL